MVELTLMEKKQLELMANDILMELKSNSVELGRLALEASAAAASVNSRNDSLASQGILKRFWNNLTGKNRKTQLQINYDNSRALYLSEQILLKMAKMQQMNLSVIQIVHTRLKTFISDTEANIDDLYMQINDIYTILADRFVKDINELRSNVNLLMWVNEMRTDDRLYKMNKSVAIVKLVYDFYNIVGMQYNGIEFSQLRTAIVDRFDKGSSTTYRDFIEEIKGTQIAEIFSLNQMTLPENAPVSVGLRAGSSRVKEVAIVDIDAEIPLTDFAVMLLGEIDEIACSEWEIQLPKIIDAAQHNDASAQYILGKTYCEGRRVPKNIEKGKQWLALAVSNGSIEAVEYFRGL